MTPSQLVLIDGQALTEQDVLNAVDDVLLQMQETQCLDVADQALRNLNRIEETSGLAKAKLLHGMYIYWVEHNLDETGDNFFDHVASMGQQKAVYAKRLITVWHHQDDLPDAFKSRPVKDQIHVAAAMEQGYTFTKKDMDALTRSSKESEVLEIVRGVKGKPPRKSSMQLKLSRDGSLNAWENNKKHFVGFLNIKERESDPVIRKAIERILSCAGIIEQ